MAFCRSTFLTAAIVLSVDATASAGSAAKAVPTLVTIVGFNGADGATPTSGLTPGRSGLLYGTTSSGTIYSVDVNGDSMSVLYTLKSGDGMGSDIRAGLTLGNDGNLYGTTSHGDVSAGCYDNGATGCGAVFSITPGGVPTVLHQFAGPPLDGWEAYSAPIQAADGNFYGTTYRGGTYNMGTVYRISSGGDYAVLHSFSGGAGDGDFPEASLLAGPNPAFLYGTTTFGGAANMGTVFRITLAGNVKLLHTFTGTPTDGRLPVAPLILASNGHFYGTTQGGGGNGCWPQYIGCGTIYEISASGKFVLRHVFSGGIGGEYPVGPLMQALDGFLYGTTQNGGTFNTVVCWISCGTIFRMGLSGTLKTLDSFGSGDGWLPDSGLTQGPDLLLYGTTPTGDSGLGGGTIYALVPVNPTKKR